MRDQSGAAYSYRVYPHAIAVFDHDEGRSVTNDAARVIQELAVLFDLSKYRVIYRDICGIWDELKIENGRFAGYVSTNETDLDAALAKLAPDNGYTPWGTTPWGMCFYLWWF
jgi:hypothetical protein